MHTRKLDSTISLCLIPYGVLAYVEYPITLTARTIRRHQNDPKTPKTNMNVVNAPSENRHDKGALMTNILEDGGHIFFTRLLAYQ